MFNLIQGYTFGLRNEEQDEEYWDKIENGSDEEKHLLGQGLRNCDKREWNYEIGTPVEGCRNATAHSSTPHGVYLSVDDPWKGAHPRGKPSQVNDHGDYCEVCVLGGTVVWSPFETICVHERVISTSSKIWMGVV